MHEQGIPAGYSKRTLVEKLGIKSGFKVKFIAAPENYLETLGELPERVVLVEQSHAAIDFLQIFVKSCSDLELRFPQLKKALATNGMMWVSWPKKASKIETDLNENIVREIGLKNNLVDIKVCAVDEIWSGLKFVYRKKDR
ncbi:MAG: DUF3052 domain-containing protein [bacterium]